MSAADTAQTPPISCLPDLGRKTLVMGILNVTPDSFSDGGNFDGLETALAHAEVLIAEGADIIDIGGESTRPGATAVAADEEIRRIEPIVRAVAARTAIPISIDTYKAATADVALTAGAKIVNDVWGLQRDPDIAAVAAAHGAPVIVMHNRTEIDGSIDIIEDMKAFFARSVEIALKAGIPERHIILDPGVGFGKTFPQHLQAVGRLPEIRTLGFPILIGTSRKSLLGILADHKLEPKDRLYGTIASNVAAIMLGADIVRVHDVRAHVEAARVAEAIMKAGLSTSGLTTSGLGGTR
ncbi:dihydropteroate synthase [Methylobrevis pamukkalensis]|uniref:Dihydropteroate synthase n=1 Tax=Methylobrevis pamukkalensis TaxID=1439726 RepID=A0A1E3H4V9_9HYPH|nr:dihydropteroate synthase [Methylobrevis pamukkalensis]ODN71354.1 Dihydropteroate synthase [Methylobrevis pamukkalensis]